MLIGIHKDQPLTYGAAFQGTEKVKPNKEADTHGYSTVVTGATSYK